MMHRIPSILPADAARRRRVAEAFVFYVAALCSMRAASRNFRNLNGRLET
jgi:hypothetical protein